MNYSFLETFKLLKTFLFEFRQINKLILVKVGGHAPHACLLVGDDSGITCHTVKQCFVPYNRLRQPVVIPARGINSILLEGVRGFAL